MKTFFQRLRHLPAQASSFGEDVIIHFFELFNRLITGQHYRFLEDRFEVMELFTAMVIGDLETDEETPREFVPEEIDTMIDFMDHLMRELLLCIDLSQLDAQSRFYYRRLIGYDVLVNYEGYRPIKPARLDQIAAIRHHLYQGDCEDEQRYVCI